MFTEGDTWNQEVCEGVQLLLVVAIAMSILKHFKPVGKKETSKMEFPPFEFPNPLGSLSLEMPSTSIAAANEAVEVLEVKNCAKQHYVKLKLIERLLKLE